MFDVTDIWLSKVITMVYLNSMVISRCKIYTNLPQGCILKKIDECCFEPDCTNQVTSNIGTVATSNAIIEKTVDQSATHKLTANTHIVKTNNTSTRGTIVTNVSDMVGDRMLSKQKRGGKVGTDKSDTPAGG